MHPHVSDFVTIGTLIVLEGMLSADNALVMAVMVLGLPADERKKALSYGLIGAFGMRALATLLAVFLIKLLWVKVVGAAYLLYLVYDHFAKGDAHDGINVAQAKPMFGLSAFWGAVVRVEFMNLAFSIDSILVAVAMSPKLWVVLSGGILGIVAMRLVVGQLVRLVERYPALVDGAFVIIAWVALRLVAEYAHQMDWIGWTISQPLSLAVIFAIFAVSLLYARKQGPRENTPQG